MFVLIAVSVGVGVGVGVGVMVLLLVVIIVVVVVFQLPFTYLLFLDCNKYKGFLLLLYTGSHSNRILHTLVCKHQNVHKRNKDCSKKVL